MKTRTTCAAGAALLLLIIGQGLAARYTPPSNWEHRSPVSAPFYDLYVPSDIPAGTTCPMVVCLHGCCGDGIDPGEVGSIINPNECQWHNDNYNTQLEPTFIVVPHITSNWFNYHSQMMNTLDGLIAEFPIDTQRIILTGFSMGGRGCMDYLNANPTRYSCALTTAAAVGSEVNGERLKNIPMWGSAGTMDDWRDNHEMTVTPVRIANGDTRGPVPYLTGINPRYDLILGGSHMNSIEYLYSDSTLIPWALSRVNDGNNYPMIKFTQTAPDHGDVLDNATTSISVTAEAFDDGGQVLSVQFFIDGTPVSTDTEAPYEATVSGLTPGDHVLTATATDNGTSQGYAMDKTQTATLKFGIDGTPAITNPSLPAGANGVFYRHRFACTGGNAPLDWRTSSTLPLGLKLWRNGAFEGVPLETGSFPLTITVTDDQGDQATLDVTLTVDQPPPGIAAITNFVENAQATFYPGLMAEGEPYEINGFGDPCMAYGLGDFNPVFDVITHPGDLDGSLLFRGSTLNGDITSTKDTIMMFDVSTDVTLHVLYPRHDNNVFPSWLAAQGYTQTGDTIQADRQEYIEFDKSVSGGSTVVMPGNDGTATEATRHYLLVVQSANPIVANRPRQAAVRPAAAPQITQTGRALRLDIPEGNQCRLTVTDTRGRVVMRHAFTHAGAQSVRCTQAAGVYILRARWNGGQLVRSLTLR